MLWYKRWTDRRSNAQLHRVGFWGTVVFDALCDISAERDFNGIIPAEYLEIDFLIRFIGILPEELMGTGDPMDLKGVIEEALEAVKQVKLVSFVSSVSSQNKNVSSVSCDFWRIDGWERRQPKPKEKSTDRVRKHRKEQRKHIETPGNAFHDVSETHETPETSQEKRREEKRRREKKSIVDEKPSTVAKTESKETSPIKELTSRLTAAFFEVRKEAYLHQGAKDAVALKRLLSFDAAEVERRWRRGLSEADRWLNISTFAQLAQKWNDLGSKAPGTVSLPAQKTKRPDLPKPITMEEFREKIKDQKPYEWNPPTKKKDDEAEDFGLISEATE